MTTIGPRLRRCRKRANLTIPQLARAAQVGIGTISDIENGLHDPRTDTLVKLLKAMGNTSGIFKLF